MTPEAVDQRIVLSRKTHSLIAQAFSADKQLGAEVVILKQLAVEHPGKTHKIGNLVERYEGLMRQMRGKMV